MNEYAEARGRTESLDVNFVPFGLHMNTRKLPSDDAIREQFAALEAAGVTWVTLGFPPGDRAEYLDHVARFGETFLESA